MAASSLRAGPLDGVVSSYDGTSPFPAGNADAVRRLAAPITAESAAIVPVANCSVTASCAVKRPTSSKCKDYPAGRFTCISAI